MPMPAACSTTRAVVSWPQRGNWSWERGRRELTSRLLSATHALNSQSAILSSQLALKAEGTARAVNAAAVCSQPYRTQLHALSGCSLESHRPEESFWSRPHLGAPWQRGAHHCEQKPGDCGALPDNACISLHVAAGCMRSSSRRSACGAVGAGSRGRCGCSPALPRSRVAAPRAAHRATKA